MNSVEKNTQELIQAILDSEEYKTFHVIRQKVEEEPELHRQINDFRAHVFEVQNSEEPLDMYQEQEKLVHTYVEFRKNPLVNDYLQSELSVCRMLQRVIGEIISNVDVDIDGIAEKVVI